MKFSKKKTITFLRLLTGKTIANESDAIECMKLLHNTGAKTVVITSSLLGPNGDLTAFGSTSNCQATDGMARDRPPNNHFPTFRVLYIGKPGTDSTEVWKLDIPRLPHLFTGTGDLFAALLLAWLHRSDGNLPLALNNSVSSLQGVLRRTASYAEEQVRLGKPYGVKILELRLIQSKEDIENPPKTFTAIRLS